MKPLRKTPSFILGAFLILLSVLLLAYNPVREICCDEEPRVTMRSPREGATVAYVEKVDGDAEHLEPDRYIWVVVKPERSSRFYPQVGPSQLKPDGSWESTAYFGSRPDEAVGERFTIFAIASTPEGNAQLQEYVNGAADRGHPGLADLPPGSIRSETATVVRK